MEIDLVSLLFDSFIASLESFVSNDISVMLLGALSLIFIVFAYFKIIEFLSMNTEAWDAKSAFNRYQSNKDDWRAPLYKEDYYQKLERYRSSLSSADYNLNSDPNNYDRDDSSISYNESHGSRGTTDYYKSFT